MTTHYPALKYPGAKWSKADWIISHFPPHLHYVEPYFGSGAVFFNKAPSAHEVVNDLCGDVVNLFQVVRNHGEELAELISLTPYSRQEYYQSYEQVDDPIEQARRFLVRCGQAHGFKPYCRTGWRHNGSKSLQPVTNRWMRIPDSVRGMMGRLRHAEIECLPAVVIIERYATADTLLYVDPPYVLSTRNNRKLYQHEMSDQDHLVLLDVLDAHPGPVVLSGYSSRLYTERLASWHTVSAAAQSEKGGNRSEVLWLNPVAVASAPMSMMEVSA